MNTARHMDQRHRGLTLIELLTVIAIIGIITVLAVPASLRALARSQLTQCTKNQYQLAFALAAYDEQHGSIPGWLNDNPNVTGTACTWTVPLLPLLGRNDIYDVWPRLPNNPTIDTFVCPSNRPGRVVLKSAPWASAKNPLEYPVVHYAGNAGAGALADITVTGTDKGDGVFKNLKTIWNESTKQWESRASVVSLDSISEADGITTTLAFVEKGGLRDPSPPHAWAYTFSGNGAPPSPVFGFGPFSPPICGVATPPGPGHPVINTSAMRAFAPSSVHAGGVVVAFCDGHTAFLSDDLQPYEYAQLITRRTRWKNEGGQWKNQTNTTAMQPWLLRSGQPYLLDENVIKQ